MTPMLKRFFCDARGVSAVEFALIAPLLILFYFATVQLDSALAVQRRVATVAGTVADLVAQDEGVLTNDELTAIYDSARAIMAPYAANTMRLRVSSVRIGDRNRPRVVWSVNDNWSSHGTGDEVAGAASLVSGTSTVIVAEAEYTYNAPLADIIDRPLVMRQTFYMRPRRVATICMKPSAGANVC